MPEFTEEDRQALHKLLERQTEIRTCLLGANHGTNDQGLFGEVKEIKVAMKDLTNTVLYVREHQASQDERTDGIIAVCRERHGLNTEGGSSASKRAKKISVWTGIGLIIGGVVWVWKQFTG